MAPEIGRGKYDRSIDIYAMGTLLYAVETPEEGGDTLLADAVLAEDFRPWRPAAA